MVYDWFLWRFLMRFWGPTYACIPASSWSIGYTMLLWIAIECGCTNPQFFGPNNNHFPLFLLHTLGFFNGRILGVTPTCLVGNLSQIVCHISRHLSTYHHKIIQNRWVDIYIIHVSPFVVFSKTAILDILNGSKNIHISPFLGCHFPNFCDGHLGLSETGVYSQSIYIYIYISISVPSNHIQLIHSPNIEQSILWSQSYMWFHPLRPPWFQTGMFTKP